MSKILQMLFGLLMAFALSACAPPTVNFKGTALDDDSMGGNFTLTDFNGQPRSLESFRGKVVALFFGYTNCPDVCPTTMLEYAAVMKQLGADADKVQVLFVSVDPERDTPRVLAGYVPHFDKRFIGLTGTVEQIEKVKKQYKVVAQKVPTPGGGYSVDHSAGSYLLDRDGKLRVFQSYGTPAANLAYDIKQLIR
ncbi:SCO family protein [Chromobacterium sphagni]|uniref:Photosynthetic protein synthase I n=1 Tax=Chromobacterium sphagni TaxID=1903179 RepID=A0A1S1WYZ3_9NEIS|nr:SCO family protein [Chromobacterium sphagni]OHX12484.1 photosynthetic protein synthase I [Chromobacterium sphagni]OHX21430.1 photosynthetic protein synthase I [Chromobacterium sphagni]